MALSIVLLQDHCREFNTWIESSRSVATKQIARPEVAILKWHEEKMVNLASEQHEYSHYA